MNGETKVCTSNAMPCQAISFVRSTATPFPLIGSPNLTP